MITREHIMNTTPENLAAEFTPDQLQRELEYYAPDEFDDYLGSSRYTDFSGTIVTADDIEHMERYFCDEEHPEVTPEDLAIAFHLWAAWCYAVD